MQRRKKDMILSPEWCILFTSQALNWWKCKILLGLRIQKRRISLALIFALTLTCITHPSLRHIGSLWLNWFDNILVVSTIFFVRVMLKHWSIMSLGCYQSFLCWKDGWIWCNPWFKLLHNCLHTIRSIRRYLHLSHNILQWSKWIRSPKTTSVITKPLEGNSFIVGVLTLPAFSKAWTLCQTYSLIGYTHWNPWSAIWSELSSSIVLILSMCVRSNKVRSLLITIAAP